MNKKLFLALESGGVRTFQDFHRQFSHVLDDRTFEGDSALHCAAREGHQHIAEWILQMKPSLAGARNNDDNTPLQEAAKSGNRDLVDILLRHNGSCAWQCNMFGETALTIAARYGHVQTVRSLLEAMPYNDTTETHQSLREATYWEDTVAICHLHAAVHGGKLEVVVAILNDRAWRNELMIEKDKSGRCAVHVAAMKGHWNIISEFISLMPDCIEIRSLDHKSVLHFAVEYNQFVVVKNLLKGKKDKKIAQWVSRDHDLIDHNTALHLAAKNAVDPQIVEHLVSLPGLDITALNSEGMTALDIASKAVQDNPNSAIIVKLLKPKRKWQQGIDKDMINTHMVVASLIATVTFAAIFQIPGGIEDDKESVHYGAARLGFAKLFRLFIFSDTAAFITSLSVVVEWLVQQKFQNTYLAWLDTYMLSDMSGVTLLIAILWTTIAFMSAIIIVIIPYNFESLKSKHGDVFSKYKLLLEYEIFLALITSYLVASTLAFVFQMFTKKLKVARNPSRGVFFHLCMITIFILICTFK
ncbi:hypothetical protein SUGI_0561910 [Cryptomeria japonica]|uniref:ankyrin repeat-containing protein At5g02620 n=1 Tax=Cryptomeria japonica TaxID=3369 RepID=UPI002408BEC1|nr:ankyrin repeat-containing protein At5g02620 [Cryptomeria japonica]GLJ28556.1 hypothetical protein SUGI_0561910 [Cryptomeria japonica]